MSNLNVVVLVSIARHDKSGRPMLAPNDIQALEQARSICAVPRVVHVGQPGDEMVLRQYLGLGFPRLEVIEAEPGQDICAQLSAYLKQEPADLIFTGRQAQGNQDTGLLPYILADQLHLSLVDNALSCELKGDQLEITQFQPKGRRRVLKQTLPALITCSDKTPVTLEYLARAARQGELQIIRQQGREIPELLAEATVEASKPGRKRLTIKSEKSAFDRLHSKVAVAGGGGQVVSDGSADDKANRVLDLLIDRGALKV